MASDKHFVDYVVEQAALGDSLTCKKMFGEYALYHSGKVIALVCDNSLFIKPSPATTSLTAHLPQSAPYPGAKPMPVADELLDESELLRKLLLATSDALPMPKPKKQAKSTGTPM